MGKTNMWPADSAHRRGRYLPIIGCSRGKYHTTHNWQILLLCQGRGSHHVGGLRGTCHKKTLGMAIEQVMEDVINFLNYVATHTIASIQYSASGMVLHMDSDASYLSVRKARSRVRGFHYLSSPPADIRKQTVTTPPLNGPVHAVCSIMKNVMASAAEVDMGALFVNGREIMILRTILKEMGHPQPPTLIITDNSTASCMTNNTIRQRQSRSIDMIFYWVRDRVQQGKLIVYWGPGKDNLGDIYTKHHPPTHCRLHRKFHVHQQVDNNSNQFCKGMPIWG